MSAGILYARGQPPASIYTFKHVLIEEALYSATSEARKRQFHLQVAEAIETRFGQLLETQPEMVAEHLAVAGATEKAVGFCLKAGMRSRDRFAHTEAISHLSKGLKLLETLEPSAARDNSRVGIAWRARHDLYRRAGIRSTGSRADLPSGARSVRARGAKTGAFYHDVGELSPTTLSVEISASAASWRMKPLPSENAFRIRAS